MAPDHGNSLRGLLVDGQAEETDEDLFDGVSLVLVMNFNVRVVLCNCGNAYKLPPDAFPVVSSKCDDLNGNENEVVSEVVALKDELKERF